MKERHNANILHPGNSCDDCDKSFQSGLYLIKHRLEVHNKKYMYNCPLCYKGFANQTDLSGHINAHNNIQPFVCTICGVAYAHKKTLVRHLRKRHPDES